MSLWDWFINKCTIKYDVSIKTEEELLYDVMRSELSTKDKMTSHTIIRHELEIRELREQIRNIKDKDLEKD